MQKLCCFFPRNRNLSLFPFYFLVLITQCQQTNKAVNPVVFSLGRAPVACSVLHKTELFSHFLLLSPVSRCPQHSSPGALHCFWGCNHARNTTAKRKASFPYRRNNIFHGSPACTGQCDHRLLPQPPVVCIMMKAFENALQAGLPGGGGRAQCGVLQSEHPSKRPCAPWSPSAAYAAYLCQLLLQRGAAEPDLNTAEAQALPRTECVRRCFRKYGLSSYAGALLVLITSLECQSP